MTTRSEWLAWDRDPVTRAQVQQLVDAQEWDTLEKRMTPRIAFGTAGLRASMGAGFAHMNKLVVIQTTQGLAAHLLATDADVKRKGVVVGHDHRHQSDAFARLTAAVFVTAGIRVHFFKGICATPLVPFAVTSRGAAAGIMITASHNPKNDNGYKLYGGNGAQIIPPTDGFVAAAILQNLEPTTWDETIVDQPDHPLVTIVDGTVLETYLANMRANLRFTIADAAAANVPLPKIVYTAMHGVGHRFVERAFATFGLPLPDPVTQQCQPDPEFPTVQFPNPEEGKGALKLAIDRANETGAAVILANDPDADRLAVAERSADGTWRIFNGNETGALFGWFLLQQKSISGAHPSAAILASAVSSKMLGALCAANDPPVRFVETLTGFKWLGNTAIALESEGHPVLFAFEEAIGFMTEPSIKDKDGISASITMTYIVHHVYAQGGTLGSTLDNLYAKFGYFASNNSYFVSPSPATTAAIFDRIRAPAYPVRCGSYSIKSVRDVTRGFDSEHGVSTLPVDASSNFIAFAFENGVTICLRASGTEPKIKYYAELKGDFTRRDQVEAQLQLVVDAFVDALLEPYRNQLVPRTG